MTLGKVAQIPSRVDAAGFGFWAAPAEACHFVERVGAFLVREGREVVVDPVPGAEPVLLRLAILGPALGLLLHQRGCLVLHASAVVMNGGAVAFVGGRGWGKSTLAAALHARGHGVVADDVTAVDTGAVPAAVLPGFPQLKLWPEAVTVLGAVPDSLPRLHPDFDKRAVRADEGFPARPVSLLRIYAISDGPVAAVAPLRPSEALVELLRHWYGSRFGDQLLKPENAAARHLEQCARLVTNVTVRRLTRPTRAWSVLDLVGLVEADLRC